MPRDPNNPLNLSEHFQDAVDVVSACGEPDDAHFRDSGSDWGDEEDDYSSRIQERIGNVIHGRR